MGPKGEVTSHLSGLFYRTMELLEKGIKPIYVYDGIPSKLKQRTIAARVARREEARAEYEKAREEGDLVLMRSKAMASTRINKEIVESSKKLLELMGVAYVMAPGEGEAQASYMACSGLAYAAASQDYDTMLFGAPSVVRNLTFSGRRKLPRKNVYVNVVPEIMSLDGTLSSLGISRRQLIWIGILIGTDFNDGIEGIGPKTALKIAKGASSIEEIEAYVASKGKSFELDIREVEDLFERPEIKEMGPGDITALTSQGCDAQGVVGFMCDIHGFSRERVEKFAAALDSGNRRSRQKGIDSWL
jgi:flap endonuclease-1